ncbi:hypothetical protein [Stenotrophomonas maltophilia]|uniref:hypothetical protein n=1 Tax=Stenotrophomonas maltophilia TaxID=40324 RepID=UPI00066DA1EA|nr:hypothetical protein [Stenotrophomonas maltophilia]ELK2665457.1 hypothetical protein [Stenotrophomonas maltophilia]KUJ03816.1 hypothetical protein AR275_05195 [Stenotrophomonas maltophilia]MBH1375104.1 hypothetical protein [Stenotrophomonas maltophilia]MBH1438638.1 hypothetical protein [Stenotrophomonas maltophilia]MBH1557627.1 hypothetical protein [Stenotrophomonas maltophilia]
MTDTIDEAQEMEARHLQRALAQHATRASNVVPLTPMGECHNPDCSEDFDNDPARLFCGPACAERFEAIHQHRNA